MVKTASELYDKLLSYTDLGETTICHLHKPCDGNPSCSTTSTTQVIDFDHIECLLAKGSRPSEPSCDGVTLNNNRSVFCFVEIKGWDIFVARNIQDASDLSDQEKLKIDKQVSSFDLKGKLTQSIKDCEEIAEQTDLFPTIPYAYVIVSDINNEKNALDDLVANLSSLAETASVWTYCDGKMEEALASVNMAIKKVYAHCRDFDTVISEIRA